MARRKRVLDDGDDSDSSVGSDSINYPLHEHPDQREERELFENPYKRRRKRRDGKEDAIYGVFGDDSDDDDYRKASSSRSTHWTKAPAFVSSEKKVDLHEDVAIDETKPSSEDDDGEDDGSEEEDVAEDEDNSNDSEPSRPPSPRVRLEEDRDYEEDGPRQRTGGLGFRPTTDGDGDVEMRSGIGTRGGIGAGAGLGARGGIGSYGGIGSETPEERTSTPSFSRGGIGSAKSLASTFASSAPLKTISVSEHGSSASPVPTPPPGTSETPSGSPRASPAVEGIPTAFGRSQSQSQRFKREANFSAKPSVKLTTSEMAHFNKLSGTFGARMLEKMGWQAGAGLGVTGEGIVAPIESKLRPQKMGIAFKGFKEKTEQSKREARRRGEEVSDDEEDEKTKRMRKKVKEAEQKRSDVWKRPKKIKTKIEHKTYEQIIAEAGQEAPATGLGQIIDATGAVPREVSSLAEVNLNSWAPTSDPTRIPEIRHNIRLIAEACKSDLDSLAREAKALAERKKWVVSEDVRLTKKIDDEAELIARLQQVQLVANDINTLSKDLASVYEVSLEPFSPLVHKLVDQYGGEFDKYGLDEIVVAAISPLVRRMVASWDPLRDPKAFVSVFRGWRRALKVTNSEENPSEGQVNIYGASTTISLPQETLRPMTPFESLLWNVWLPKVRSTINNEWSPEDPQPVVKLYEAWSTFLPPFIRDNMLDQLILPKVQKAVVDWGPKRASTSLRSIVFPWLPHIGLRLEDLLGDARRKVKNLLRSWLPDEEIPDDLAAWRDVYDKGEWDTITLKYVIPKLGNALRTNFRIDPRNQKMETFDQTVSWASLIRPSIFAQLFETEFFPEWLRILHIWLIQPRVSFEEVAQWYQFWKSKFPPELQNYVGLSKCFTRGLQLMNQAIELGPDAPTKLPKPDFKTEMALLAAEAKKKGATSTATAAGGAARPSARTHEITFRSIVEEFAASHNLLLMPTGKAHAHSRMPLFRVSAAADGRKGLLVYILDDAVWASVEKGSGSELDEFRAISLDDMVNRALGG